MFVDDYAPTRRVSVCGLRYTDTKGFQLLDYSPQYIDAWASPFR